MSAFGSVFALGFAAVAVVVTRRTYQIESERDRVNAEARRVQEYFARRAQAALVRRATPRPVRQVMHPAQTVRNAAIPRPVRQVRRATYTVTNPVGAAEKQTRWSGAERRNRPSGRRRPRRRSTNGSAFWRWLLGGLGQPDPAATVPARSPTDTRSTTPPGQWGCSLGRTGTRSAAPHRPGGDLWSPSRQEVDKRHQDERLDPSRDQRHFIAGSGP
jgi:hypothetical protein